MLLQRWEECSTVDLASSRYGIPGFWVYAMFGQVFLFRCSTLSCHGTPAWDDGPLDTAIIKLYKRCMRVANAEFRDLSD